LQNAASEYQMRSADGSGAFATAQREKRSGKLGNSNYSKGPGDAIV